MERDRTMTGQQLKNAILALAVQGKLVPQDPKDEPAAALLERVKAEKARLVKAGEIKKEKPLPPITDEEKPFSIPKTWEWVRLGACSTYGQVKFKATDKDKKSKIWSLDLEDIEKDTGHILIKRKAVDKPIRGEKVKFEKGNILYSKLRPYLKKILVAEEDGICTTEIVPFKVLGNIDANYIACVLRSPHIDYEINAASYGAKMPRVGTDTMLHLLIPIPPLVEQKRIVERIEELLPRVSAYDEAEQKLSRLDAEFPDKLKQSILQQAVRGKIAKQDKNDEPAGELLKRIKAKKERLIAEGKVKKEKPLPPIAEEEKPFEIPAGWEWVRLNDLYNFIDYRGKTPTKLKSGIPLVTAKNVKRGYMDYSVQEFISEEEFDLRKSRGISRKGDILFTTEAPLGNVALADLELFSAGQRLITFQAYNSKCVDNHLMMYFLLSGVFQRILSQNKTGTTVAGIKAEKLKALLLPLPPLAEQKRIVERLEEYLALCDKMMKREMKNK